VQTLSALEDTSDVHGNGNGQGTLGPIRVLIVDDHAGFRSSMAQALEDMPQVEVAGEADSGEQACARVVDLRPDVVLIDLSMPGMDGIDATRQILMSNPETRVVMLTGTPGYRVEQSALAAGASTVVAKGTPIEDVVGVILDTFGQPAPR
jgi:DNA-binding NarL/FixJ family response regulator